MVRRLRQLPSAAAIYTATMQAAAWTAVQLVHSGVSAAVIPLTLTLGALLHSALFVIHQGHVCFSFNRGRMN